MKMKKLKNSIKTSWLPHFSIAGCLLFIIAMMLSVRGKMSTNANMYLITMTFIGVAVLLAAVWDIWSQAHMSNLFCALGILMAVGASYQAIFVGGYTSYFLSMVLSIGAGIAAYHYQRRITAIHDYVFYALTAISISLMVALVLFGSTEGGAKLGIEIIKSEQENTVGPAFRPAEFVKVILIYMGCQSYHSRLRQGLFCGASLVCCVLCVLCKDLGAAAIIFANFVIMSYLLFDSRFFSTLVVAVAVVGLWAVLTFTNLGTHARARMENLFHAMDSVDGQQHMFLRALLFGGFSGLGPNNAYIINNIPVIRSDGALIGVTAVYGYPFLALTMLAYGLLAIVPAYNRSINSCGYLLLSQMTCYIFCHSFLALNGAADLVPFTGVVSPIICSGINAFLAFGILVGLAAGSMHPAQPYIKE